MALRVVFAEDNYLVRAGTAALLAETDDLELVAAVAKVDPSSTASTSATRPSSAGRPSRPAATVSATVRQRSPPAP